MLNVIHEIWKPVNGFEKYYQISNLGRVSNYRKILKTYTINSGYEMVKFTIKNKRTSKLIHRLVAEAFLENPENKKEVNHVNGNKLLNHSTNLEWCTSSENKLHAFNTGLRIYNVPTKGKKIGKQSKYHNVTYDKSRNKWVASVRHNKKNYYTQRFNTEIEAAKHVNKILDILKLDDRPRNHV